MIQDSEYGKNVKYNLKTPVFVGSKCDRDYVFDTWAFDCVDQKKDLPEPLVILQEKDPVRDFRLLNAPKHANQVFFPCAEVWEHYEFFADEAGAIPFDFQYGFTVSEGEEEIELATDEPATDEPATDEPATDEPATDEPAGMTEEEKRAERERYIRKQKKMIRRLINANQLYHMYTLTFAPEMNENVQGLRFLLSPDEQRNRGTVLTVWNSRLTDMRKFFKSVGRDFRFVMVLERHDSENTSEIKRGTYHLHLATDKPLDKHILQRLWGYGMTWVDDFTKEKKRVDGRVVNDDTGFCNDPGRYMSKYLDKDIENPEFECKHAYSSSRGNLKRPETLKIRDSEVIQEVKAHPEKELRRQGVNLHPVQWERIRALKDIEEVKTFDSSDKDGTLIKIEIPKKGESEPCVMYLRYRIYNFRTLHPKYKKYVPVEKKNDAQMSFLAKK